MFHCYSSSFIRLATQSTQHSSFVLPGSSREEAEVIDREADKCTRWLKEAIWICRRGQQTLNKDEGAYKLHNIFDQLILTTPSAGTS